MGDCLRNEHQLNPALMVGKSAIANVASERSRRFNPRLRGRIASLGKELGQTPSQEMLFALQAQRILEAKRFAGLLFDSSM